MTTHINNGCQNLFHEGSIQYCFETGKPCVYKDRESCETARILDIRMAMLRQEQLELRVQEERA